MKQGMVAIMETLERKTVFQRHSTSLLIIFIVLQVACTYNQPYGREVPYYNEASFTPLWNIDKVRSAGLHKIAPFKMVNQSGKVTTNDDLKGRITLVNFFFTVCQSVCPKMKDNMMKVQANFKDNPMVSFLSYSVTPENDSVDKLAAYAEANKIPAKQWNLVTGNKTEIYDLARKSYFIEEGPGLSKSTKQFLHTENLVLIDGDGHIRGLYNGTLEAEVPRISEDIRVLLKAL